MQDPTPTVQGAFRYGEDALADYRRKRAFSERLCEPLAVEDCVIQTAVETSPPRRHLARVTWFFDETYAYAACAGKRLHTEAEWEHAASGLPVAGNFVGEGFPHPRPAGFRLAEDS